MALNVVVTVVVEYRKIVILNTSMSKAVKFILAHLASCEAILSHGQIAARCGGFRAATCHCVMA